MGEDDTEQVPLVPPLLLVTPSRNNSKTHLPPKYSLQILGGAVSGWDSLAKKGMNFGRLIGLVIPMYLFVLTATFKCP